MKLTLKQVLDLTGSTDLRTLNLTADDPTTMSYLINQVLIDLHSRFVLNQKLVKIPLEEDKELYDINDYIKDN